MQVSYLKRALIVALWFIFLTAPLMAVRVNTLNQEIEWRVTNVLWMGGAAFLLALIWQIVAMRNSAAKRQENSLSAQQKNKNIAPMAKITFAERLAGDPKRSFRLLLLAVLGACLFPWLVSSGQNFYHVNIMTSALIFVVLGLGLNITVGLAGLLDLGYIAFFSVGAYSYGLINEHFGLGFWLCLPLGGLISMLFGVILGFPILRLRGDYLAIVTLAFGSITKIVLENWSDLSHGVEGIANIPQPELFNLALDSRSRAIYIYYIVLALVALTIFMTNRLKNSRIGRAWMALREDEIASVAMGVDMARTKLSAYAIGAFWAGLVGVVFAAQNTFINPNSFTVMDSIMVLAMVVLGGMGSIIGVMIAALFLKLLPEYLRAFSEYRMLIFGALMVLTMIFRPQGLISHTRRQYELNPKKDKKIAPEVAKVAAKEGAQ